MWTLSSLNAKSLPQLSRTLLFLLLILQVSIWYPLLQRKYRQIHDDHQQALTIDRQLQEAQRQSEQLRAAKFLEQEKINSRVVSSYKGEVTQWAIRGEAALNQWQALQETIQEKVALGLVTASWSAKANGRWQGRLVFDVLQSKRNRVYQDWLPVRLHSTAQSRAYWELVSIMAFEGETAALLSHKSSKRWVSKGAWLPTLGMSVERVLPDSVTFVSESGETLALTLRSQIGLKE